MKTSKKMTTKKKPVSKTTKIIPFATDVIEEIAKYLRDCGYKTTRTIYCKSEKYDANFWNSVNMCHTEKIFGASYIYVTPTFEGKDYEWYNTKDNPSMLSCKVWVTVSFASTRDFEVLNTNAKMGIDCTQNVIETLKKFKMKGGGRTEMITWDNLILSSNPQEFVTSFMVSVNY